MDEAQRSGIDAIPQTAAILGAIGKDMAEMAVAVARADLRADHAVRHIAQVLDVGRLDRLREARPAAARFILVGRSKQRLARDDINIDAGLLVVEIRAGARALGAALLGDAVLLRRQLGDGLGILAVVVHDPSPLRLSPGWCQAPGDITVRSLF